MFLESQGLQRSERAGTVVPKRFARFIRERGAKKGHDRRVCYGATCTFLAHGVLLLPHFPSFCFKVHPALGSLFPRKCQMRSNVRSNLVRSRGFSLRLGDRTVYCLNNCAHLPNQVDGLTAIDLRHGKTGEECSALLRVRRPSSERRGT